MKTLAQEYAEYSRVTQGDGSIRPMVDTGFRMPGTESAPYVRRENSPTKQLLDYVHEDDIATKTPARGLRGVFYITVNETRARARIVADIQRNIERTNGKTIGA